MTRKPTRREKLLEEINQLIGVPEPKEDELDKMVAEAEAEAAAMKKRLGTRLTGGATPALPRKTVVPSVQSRVRSWPL